MDYRLLCIALAVACVNAANINVNVDSDTEKRCGSNVNLNNGDTITFGAPGKISATGNTCPVHVVAAGSKPNNCKYRQICIAPKAPFTFQCFADLNIRWIEQGNTLASADLSNCTSSRKMMDSYCAAAETMEIEIYEKSQKLYRSYNFDAIITLNCSDSEMSQSLQTTKTGAQGDVEEPDWAQLAAQVHQNRMGLITGVCLAVVFLIIFAITYCYYKNKPYRQVPK